MTEYVVGFVFSADRMRLALIEKQKPKWQAGKLNGIGGKVEPGEQHAVAQSREFHEETGVLILPQYWRKFAVLAGPDYRVTCFVAFDDAVLNVQTMEKEQVVLILCNQFPLIPNLIDNLSYLVPLSLDDTQTGVPLIEYGAAA